MMSVPPLRRTSNALNSQLVTCLLLCMQVSLCIQAMLWQAVDAAELPAELMLEGVRLLKSMEYAQERQHQQQQQRHQQQKSHFPHTKLKRFIFNQNSAAAGAATSGADADVDIDGMQPPAMSQGDIERFERELFLQSAIDDVPLNDGMELPPFEADSMEHADLMERAIDYKQHQPSLPSSMWLQQPHNSGKGDNSEIASGTFTKSHQKHSKHRLGGDAASSTESGTLVPPPLPVAEPQRHCAIEISTKLTGVCQVMGPIGLACVAGDYMDVYNEECM